MANAVSMKAGMVALCIKLGPKILTLLAKMMKFTKVGLFAASLGAYAFIFSWQFAAIIMAQLFVHESGHIWAMKKRGMKTRGIYFIPFIGGAAVADDAFKTRETEYFVGIMGPVWGFSLALACALLHVATDSMFLAVAANWMAAVNLFNLLPVNPMDGGRMLKSMAFSVSTWLGLGVMAFSIVAILGMAHFVGLGLVAFLLFISSVELLFEWGSSRRRRQIAEDAAAVRSKYQAEIERLNEDVPEELRSKVPFDPSEELDAMIKSNEAPPPMTPKEIVIGGVCYFLIVAAIFVVMWGTDHGPSALEMFAY